MSHPHTSPTTRVTALVRRIADDPTVTQLVSLAFGGTDDVVHGREAILAALGQRLARGERIELVPSVEVVPAGGAEVQAMRDLRGAEDGGVWRWYASDRTVRWAPAEGAPWAQRWKATRAACETPGELWERLVARAILLLDVVDEAARVFIDRPRRNAAAERGDVPRNLPAALLLASDFDGVRCAEALAGEAVEALTTWNGMRPQRVAWSNGGHTRAHAYVYDRGASPAPVIPNALWRLIEQTEAALAERRPFITALERAAHGGSGRPEIASAIAEAHLAWRRWCAEDRRVPETAADWPIVADPRSWYSPSVSGRLSRWKAPEGVAGKRFRELPDPTRPLVGIVALGYTPLQLSRDHVSLHHPTPK